MKSRYVSDFVSLENDMWTETWMVQRSQFYKNQEIVKSRGRRQFKVDNELGVKGYIMLAFVHQS